jgi:hypothetical protein
MKTSNGSPRRLRKSIDTKRRTQLLVAFDHSGLSAAAFARQHGIHYTTFCDWRHRRAKSLPGFVEVELPRAAVPVEVMVELGEHARIRITSTDQVEVVARLLQALNAPTSC